MRASWPSAGKNQTSPPGSPLETFRDLVLGLPKALFSAFVKLIASSETIPDLVLSLSKAFFRCFHQAQRLFPPASRLSLCFSWLSPYRRKRILGEADG